MITTQIGFVDNKSLTYHQCETEAETQGLPPGLSGYWVYEGQKIYAPGEVVSLITQNAAAGKLQIESLTNPSIIQTHYQKVRQSQQKMVAQQFENMIAHYKNDPNIPDKIKGDLINQMERSKKIFSDPNMYPDANGVFKPTKEQIETIVGKDVARNMGLIEV